MSAGHRILVGGVVVLVVAFAPGARADDGGAGDARAGPSAATLETLIDQLLSADRNMRRAAARSIDTLGAGAAPILAGELARRRPGRPAPEVAALLARLHPAPGADGSAEGERAMALLELTPDASGPAYAYTTVTLTLTRALAHIATPESVAAFAPVALDARGAFVPDVHRHLVELGERATAGLVLMAHSRSPPAEKWAASELEALGKRTPGDAIQTKSKEVLADVLLAYGTVADPDALPVVMSFVNADKKLVREAARESIARYGDVATAKLAEAYGLLVGEAAPADWPTAWLRGKLWAALDRVRLEDVDARVNAGLALAEKGQFADAVAAFDDVLARQPDWDKKAELVPAYVFLAEAVLADDPGRARDLLEKALRLDPSGPRAAQSRSLLLVLEGKELERRGISDPEPFRRALALDPGNAEASSAVLRMEEEARARRKAWEKRFTIGGGILFVVSALILFVGKRRR